VVVVVLVVVDVDVVEVSSIGIPASDVVLLIQSMYVKTLT